MLLAAVAYYQWWAWHEKYPFGREHCCDKQLLVSLWNYADEHGGKFPSGGATPEASLSLLYPKFLDANVLRGKGYSEEAAAKLLHAGKPLTPEACGWHYVEGLSMLEEGTWNGSRIAIFWDKIGLGHNSERLPPGAHTVNFIHGSGHVILGEDWDRFVAEQEKAVAAIRRGEDPGKPWLPEYLDAN
jgi:hypothetical protein